MVVINVPGLIEKLISETDTTDDLISRIQEIINDNYFKNADGLSDREVSDLYELEQAKRFFRSSDLNA